MNFVGESGMLDPLLTTAACFLSPLVFKDNLDWKPLPVGCHVWILHQLMICMHSVEVRTILAHAHRLSAGH